MSFANPADNYAFQQELGTVINDENEILKTLTDFWGRQTHDDVLIQELHQIIDEKPVDIHCPEITLFNPDPTFIKQAEFTVNHKNTDNRIFKFEITMPEAYCIKAEVEVASKDHAGLFHWHLILNHNSEFQNLVVKLVRGALANQKTKTVVHIGYHSLDDFTKSGRGFSDFMHELRKNKIYHGK